MKMKFFKFLVLLLLVLVLTSCSSKKVDLSSVVFEDETVYYDGQKHMIFVSGLPEGVDVSYNEMGFVGEGIYTVVATFRYNNEVIGTKTATLSILKAPKLNIFLKDKTVVYDGNEHTIDPEGELPSDLVITYQDKFVNAGEYTVRVMIQSESVYIPEEQRTLEAKLTIEKATFDTSSLVFSQNEFDYDGNIHGIYLTSTLPRDVSIYMENYEQREIGVYDVIVTFDVGNNYIQPEPLHLQLIIKKPAGMFKVTFVDGDNTFDIFVGKDENYHFPNPTAVRGYLADWDKDLSRIEEDMVVTRVLTLLEYKLSVDFGSATPYTVPEYISVETEEISLPDPVTPDGVYFEGWFTSPTFEENTRITCVPAGVGADGHYWVYAKTFNCSIENAHLYEKNEYEEYYYKLYQYDNKYDIIGLFEINLPATWEIYSDYECTNKLEGYVLDLEEGNNTHYIKVVDGNYSKVYTIITEFYNKFEILYHVSDEQVISVKYDLVEYMDEFLEYPVYGYTFEGWTKEDGTDLDFVYLYPGFMHAYIKLSPIEYNIVYNGVPEGVVNNNISTYTVETEYKFLDLEKTGYNFIGWFVDSACLTEYPEIIKGTSDTITLYAKFEASDYKVTINDNTYDVTYDEAFSLDVLNANGKVFLGYYTLENGQGTKMTDENGLGLDVFNIASDVTLYPYYSLNEYTIKYNVDDNSVSDPEDKVYTVEDEFDLPALTKVGHTFDGWYLNSDYTGDKYIYISNEYQNLEFYGRFTPNTYSVTVNGSKYDVTYGNSFTLDFEEVFGMKFEGYYTAENGEGQKVVASNGVSSNGYSFDENITLYPYYTLVNYTISYETKGGLLVDNNYEYTYEYNINSTEILLPELYIGNGEFIGWYDNEECLGDPITSIPTGSNGDKVFYAKFEYSSFEITYTDYNRITITYDTLGGNNINSTEMSVGSRLTRPYWNPEKEGYLFTGWYKDRECSDIFLFDENLYADTTLYAGWYKPTYQCENTNNLLDATKYSASYNTITQDLYRNSYYKWTFVAPQTKTEMDSSAYSIYYKQSYGSQIYFQYNISLYNVTQDVEVFADTYDGSNYKGQQFIANAGDILTLTITYPMSHPSVYESKATFYFGNFAHPYESTTFENSIEVNYGDNFVLPVRTVNGATFMGYFTEANGKGTKVTDEFGASLVAFDFTEPLLVYPFYDCPKYSIQYDLAGLEVPNTVKFINEYDVTLAKRALPNLNISGYTFRGWYLNEDFSGDKVTMIPQDASGDLVFYADIEANEYNLYVSYASSVTVTFDPQDNGYNSIKTVTLNKKNPVLTPPSYYYRQYYVLAGWYTEPECINQYMFDKPVTSDFTLYAKWVYVYGAQLYTPDPAEYVYNPSSNLQSHIFQASVAKNGETGLVIVLNQDYTESNPFEMYYANTWGGTGSSYAYYLSVKNLSTEEILHDNIFVPYQSTYSSVNICGKKGDIIYIQYKAYNNKTTPSIAFMGYAESPKKTAAVGYTIPVKYYSSYTIDVKQVPGLRIEGFYTQANGEGELYIDKLGNPINKNYNNLGDVTVYAYLTDNPYEITYYANGGELVDSTYEYVPNYRIDSEIIVLPELQKTGYTFDGWYTNKNFEGEAIGAIQKGSYGDIYLYAKFTAFEFTISSPIADSATIYFDPQNGEEVYSLEISKDQVLEITSEPTYENYYFIGWFKDQECTEAYTFNEIVYPGMTLYAGWIPQSELVNGNNYNKIDPSGHDSEATDLTVYVYSSVRAYSFILNQNTDEIPLTLRTAMKENVNNKGDYAYYFSVYNETTGEVLVNNYYQSYYWGNPYSQYTIKGNIGDIITITVKANKYTTRMHMYFDGYVGLESTSSLTLNKVVQYGSEFTLDVPNIEGKKFLGYFTLENGQGTQITDSEGKSLAAYTYLNDLVLYAHYIDVTE